jgi:hypothetical protein
MPAQPPRHPHVLERRPEQRLLRRIAQLEERIAYLERNRRGVPVVSAVPSDDAGDGSLAAYENGSTRRLYVRVNGTWRYATLT